MAEEMTEGQWQEFAEVPRDEDEYEGPGEEPKAWGAPEPEEEEQDTSSTFDPKWRNPFEGLTYLGYLSARVEIPYHTFTVRTLKTGEKIKVTELIQHLEPSISYARAYRAAVVAAGLLLVDGKPLLTGSKQVDAIAQRYRYITDNWHDPVIDILYGKINDLEGKVLEVLKELGVYEPSREVVQVDEVEVTGQVE